MAAKKKGSRKHSPQTKRGTSIDDLRALALGLPDVHERAVHDTPGFYIGKKLFAWVLKDRTSVVVWMDLERREAVVAESPEIFSVTPHYAPHPMVVVQLATVKRALLRKLLADSLRQRAPARAHSS